MTHQQAGRVKVGAGQIRMRSFHAAISATSHFTSASVTTMKGTTMKIRYLILCAPVFAAQATMVPVDLGPPKFYQPGNVLQVPFTLAKETVSGQTLSLDLMFSNNQFVSIVEDTQHRIRYAFILQIELNAIGAPGNVLFLLGGSTYTIGPLGQNSPTFTMGEGTTVYSFPLLADVNGTPRNDVQSPFPVYGMHAEINLPFDPDWTLTGGSLFLGEPGAAGFGVGLKTPETGQTAALLGLALLILVFYNSYRQT